MDAPEDAPISGTGPAARLRGLLAVLRTPGCLIALAFLAGAVVLGRWVESIGGPEAIIDRYGLWAPLVTVPLHAVLAVSPFPSELFVIAGGAAYGFELGALLGWIGWILGSALEYALARRSAADFDLAGRTAKLPPWLRRWPLAHPAVQICGRWVPFGFHIVNLASGATRVPLPRFLLFAALGSVPGALLFAGIGAGIRVL